MFELTKAIMEPRIKPLLKENRTAAVEAVFEQHIKAFNGRITNMKATMGKAPLVFDVYMMWYNLYEEVKKITGNRAAYLFAYAISTGSNCPLCTTYFRKVIIDNGEKPESLILTEKEQALIDFGSEIAANKGEVSDATYKPIKETYTEEQIIILTGFAGQMIATNIFNNVLRVEIDEYLADYISISKK